MSRLVIAAACVALPYTPAWTQDGTFEQASTVFIERYLQAWSGSTEAALAYMDEIYPDQVEFYGKTLTHTALMAVKRRFTERWPERSYGMRRNSMQVYCDEDHLCTVQVIFDWHYRNPERQANATGSASLRLELQDGMTIISEDGGAVRPNGNAGLTAAHAPQALATARPAASPDGAAVPVKEASPHVAEAPPLETTPEAAPEPAPAAAPPPGGASAGAVEPSPRQEEFNPPREEIAALRDTYFAHVMDKDWITTWLSHRRTFSGEATFVGATEEKPSAGPADVLHTADFSSSVGGIACVNANDAGSLKIGEKVNIQGVITIFIDDVMYLGQCSIEPG